MKIARKMIPSLLLVIATPGMAAASAFGDSETLRNIEKMVDMQINRERARRGRRPLIVDRRLTSAARSHSARMAKSGFFSHVDPRRGDLEKRLSHSGIRWTMIAENISYALDPRASASALATGAVQRWMRSSGHRSNLTYRGYTHSGIGAAFSRRGELYLTQIYLRR